MATRLSSQPPCCARLSQRRRACCASAAASARPASPGGCVLVTREAGKNGPLTERLRALGIAARARRVRAYPWLTRPHRRSQFAEVPLIEHGSGPDRHRLAEALRERWEWVVLTSPEAASVFLEGWEEAGRPETRVATVGRGTSAVLLRSGGPAVAFTPSLANAETLAAELPLPASPRPARVLYPASALARAELQRGLESRGGFQLVRLNTYDTVPSSGLPEGAAAASASTACVTFASPSAVKAWCALLRPLLASGAQPPAVACIGLTSARAAAAAGLSRVYYPDAPGVEGWAEAVQAALRGDPPRDAELQAMLAQRAAAKAAAS